MSSAAVKPADFEPGNAELLGWEQYGDVAVLRMNEPERRINLFDAGLVDALTRAVARVRAEPGVRGAVLISAKSSGFLRGADFDRLFEQMLAGLPLEAAAGRFAREHALMRAIEAGGKPFVAAINGHVLGGGLELCLSCHGRLVADDPSIRFGLPEVSLGLIPACGGTQRLPRLIGIPAALSMIVDGRKLAPRDALAARLVDAVVPPDELLGKAIEWVRAHADAQQPWDQRGYRVPGGAGALAPHASQAFYIGMARLRARTHDNYPAPAAALRAVYEGTQLPLDRGLAVEAECFAQLFCHPTAAHLLRTFFIHRGRTRSPAPALVERMRTAYADEGAALLRDGAAPALIENVARMAGLAAGPLAGGGRGIDAEARTVADADPHAAIDAYPRTIQRRLMFIQILAALSCVEDGTVASAADADLASVLEGGFPAWTGGVASYVDDIGGASFVADCDRLADAFGERFRPSTWLRRQLADRARLTVRSSPSASLSPVAGELRGAAS